MNKPVYEAEQSENLKRSWEEGQDGWEIFLPDEGKLKPVVSIKVADRGERKTTVTLRSRSRDRVVARGNKKLLEKHQFNFGLNNAGVEMYGGPMPLWSDDKSTVVGYEQNYRYTVGL